MDICSVLLIYVVFDSSREIELCLANRVWKISVQVVVVYSSSATTSVVWYEYEVEHRSGKQEETPCSTYLLAVRKKSASIRIRQRADL